MSKNLTINQIIKNIQSQTGLDIEIVEQVAKAFVGEMSNSLITSRNIRLEKLGTLGVKIRKGRPVKIPKTDITINVPDKKVVYFTPYENIETALNT